MLSCSQSIDFVGSAGPDGGTAIPSGDSSTRIKYMEAKCTLVTMAFFTVDRSCHGMDFLVL